MLLFSVSKRPMYTPHMWTARWRGEIPALATLFPVGSSEMLVHYAFRGRRDGPTALTPEHVRFFRYWMRQFNRGVAVDVQGNLGYLFTGACEIVRQLRGDERFSYLRRLYDEYRELVDGDVFLSDIRLALSNCYVERGELDTAYAVVSGLGRDLAIRHNYRLNLKWHLGLPVDARDMYSIFHWGDTSDAKDWKRLIPEELNAFLGEWRRSHPLQLLQVLANHSSTSVDEHMLLFNSSAGCQFPGGAFDIEPVRVPLKRAAFHISPEFKSLFLELRGKADAAIRARCGIPPLGEGWPTEAGLFHEIKTRFPRLVVEHNAKPAWLAPQHLDIYFPEANLGVEFQGAQHDSPVEFFGGKNGLEKRKQLDAGKHEKCLRNGCRLLLVYPGYDIETVETEVRTALRELGKL